MTSTTCAAKLERRKMTYRRAGALWDPKPLSHYKVVFSHLLKLLKILMKYHVSAMQFTRVGTYLGKVLEISQ